MSNVEEAEACSSTVIRCDRCKEKAASIEVRAQQMCRDCFMAYVTTKIVKQIEDFKVRYTKDARPLKVLLPLSLGPSSITLLHLLDEHLSRQLQKAARTGFELLILVVADSSSDAQLTFEGVKERYPSHRYELLPLHDIFRYHSKLEEIFSQDACSKPAQDVPSVQSATLDEKLVTLFSSVPSASSKEDLLRILRLRLVVAYAKENDTDCIVWGDSTTRLAEKTLSETAKGRGFSLPWQTGDGPSPYGVEFKFPMRGLLRKEIVLFSSLTSPALTSLVVDRSSEPANSVSSKNLTIDALMGRYFASVENSYPSIVTNVVRTTNRLQAPEPSSSSEICGLCGMQVEPQANVGKPSQTQEILPNLATDGVSRERLCHGCSTSLLNLDGRK